MHFRTFDSIPGLYPFDASSIPPVIRLKNVPWGQHPPLLVENYQSNLMTTVLIPIFPASLTAGQREGFCALINKGPLWSLLLPV